MRLAIVGNSGSGKSTLARRAAAAAAPERVVAHLDLDSIAWEPSGTSAVPPRLRPVAEAAADVRAFCRANEHWVVEGCYAGLVRAALKFSPTLIFLDPGVDACLEHCRNRPWEPHKYKSKGEQDEKLAFLFDWVRGYYTRDDGDLCLKAHRELFDGYVGPKRRVERHSEVE